MDYNPVSRVWIAGHGYRQVPPDVTRGKTLYAHPDGHFLNRHGMRIAHSYTPNRKSQVSRKNKPYPYLPHYGRKDCHYIMACTFLHVPDRAKGEQIDHINGDALNYSTSNLRIIDASINARDGGFLRKLRNKGINPRMYAQAVLLQYFERMAEYKRTHSDWEYRKLARKELLQLLVGPKFRVCDPGEIMEYEMTHHVEE